MTIAADSIRTIGFSNQSQIWTQTWHQYWFGESDTSGQSDVASSIRTRQAIRTIWFLKSFGHPMGNRTRESIRTTGQHSQSGNRTNIVIRTKDWFGQLPLTWQSDYLTWIGQHLYARITNPESVCQEPGDPRLRAWCHDPGTKFVVPRADAACGGWTTLRSHPDPSPNAPRDKILGHA